MSLAQDQDASAKVSSTDLDRIYRKLAQRGRVPRRLPTSYFERNERIYAALGYIPGRDIGMPEFVQRG